MPGIQAIERIEKKIPMRAGKPERIEYEYKRHGTLCLIGNWHVVSGQVIAPSIGTKRLRLTEKCIFISPESGSQARRGPAPAATASDPPAAQEGEATAQLENALARHAGHTTFSSRQPTVTFIFIRMPSSIPACRI